jgi:hypothetical protein
MLHQRTANGTNRGPRLADEIKIKIRFAFGIGKASIYNDSLIHRCAIRIRLKFYGGTEEKEEDEKEEEEEEEEEEENAQSSITLRMEDYETFREKERERKRGGDKVRLDMYIHSQFVANRRD